MTESLKILNPDKVCDHYNNGDCEYTDKGEFAPKCSDVQFIFKCPLLDELVMRKKVNKQ